jgi:hypothetical protein
MTERRRITCLLSLSIKGGSEWSHSEPFCSWVEILIRIIICCLLSFYRFEFFLTFWAKQRTCFYRFRVFLAYSGKAEELLLPFSGLSRIFGQSRGVAFTVFGSFSHIQAKQRTCFYRFGFFLTFSSKAEDLFLPSWVHFRFLDKA